jgi:hypothetical protein
MNPITEMLVDALKRLQADGWDLPIYFTAIAANGSVLCGRYDANDEGGVEARMIAEHFEDNGFRMPINMMLSNVKGEAVRLSIQNPDVGTKRTGGDHKLKRDQKRPATVRQTP